MTKLTYNAIQLDTKIFGTSYGPDQYGKYGIYIGTTDESPSGSPRPRCLLSSIPCFDTLEEAKNKAQEIVIKIRNGGDHTQWDDT